MRVKRLTTWLVLGIALSYAARRRGRRVAERRAVPYAPHVPTTPAQIDGSSLGRPDLEGEMFVEAISEWDPAPEPDLDVAVADPMAGRVDLDPDTISDDALGEPARPGAYGERRAHDSGDLYGVHVVPGIDTSLPDDDQTHDVGENWLEHLEHTAAELGPEPERVLDMSDDSDHAPRRHKSAKDDIPVADHGSGGPRGL